MSGEATLEPVDFRIGEFCKLVNAGVEAWVQAGEILCQMKENDPNVFNAILATNPHLSHDILVTFERIGKKEVYPYLLIDNSPSSRMLSALPYETQVKLYRGEVPVVVRRGDHTTTLRKRVADLTLSEASRAFAAGGLRPVAEQTKLVQQTQEENRRKREAVAGVETDQPEEEEDKRSLANRLACAIVCEYSLTPGQGDDDSRSALFYLIGAQLTETPLDKDHKAALWEALTLAQELLIEARLHLAHVQQNSKFDAYIQHALTPIGHLRFALNAGGVQR